MHYFLFVLTIHYNVQHHVRVRTVEKILKHSISPRLVDLNRVMHAHLNSGHGFLDFFSPQVDQGKYSLEVVIERKLGLVLI